MILLPSNVKSLSQYTEFTDHNGLLYCTWYCTWQVSKVTVRTERTFTRHFNWSSINIMIYWWSIYLSVIIIISLNYKNSTATIYFRGRDTVNALRSFSLIHWASLPNRILRVQKDSEDTIEIFYHCISKLQLRRYPGSESAPEDHSRVVWSSFIYSTLCISNGGTRERWENYGALFVSWSNPRKERSRNSDRLLSRMDLDSRREDGDH